MTEVAQGGPTRQGHEEKRKQQEAIQAALQAFAQSVGVSLAQVEFVRGEPQLKPMRR